MAPGSIVKSHYSIMNFFGAATGNFAGVAAPGGLIGTTTVGSNEVFLDFTLDYGAKYGLNVNQTERRHDASEFLQRQWRSFKPNSRASAPTA